MNESDGTGGADGADWPAAADGGRPGRYPCAACGHTVFEDPPGSSMICPVCKWEDDASQLRWPTMERGANRVSLVEAQRTYALAGVSEERFASLARPPGPGEEVVPGWRPVDASDSFEAPLVQDRPWPADRTVLYWWTRRFWRRDDG
ncbi:CPCC family cysteine-rich protein [Streptomyces sp. NPDC001743]|uniref:CPCC family cysteine-rich protein n=1 Tax=Streptomyces sp. NPDC001743 TaxID=3154397 RepID=UPI0033285D27